MAALYHLLPQIELIAAEVYARRNEAEKHKKREYKAAVTIQAWIRACRVRRYIQYLHGQATVIQKHWRAFLGRREAREVIRMAVHVMHMNYYNKMATKIQKSWRGFYSRKYVFSFDSRQRYLRSLEAKNETVREELELYAAMAAEERQKKAEERAQEERDLRAYREHHMLSTMTKAGIYRSPHKGKEGEEWEQKMRALQLGSYKYRTPPMNSHYLCYNRNPLTTKLPPLPDKPQGPFREPAEVQGARYQPFKPTLRAATDFRSLDKAQAALKACEWTHRLHDQPILIDSKHQSMLSQGHKKHYEPLLFRQAPFGRMAYGSKHFREEDPSKRISCKPFKIHVPSIPFFGEMKDRKPKDPM